MNIPLEFAIRNRIKDITGKQFGRLLVLRFSHTDERNKAFWRCLCECGKQITTTGHNLKSGHTKSCGCQRSDSASNNLQDLTGQRFERLLVLEKAHRKINGTGFHWKCLCDCGNIVYPHSQSLKDGKTKSCGCYHSDKLKSIRRERHHAWKGGTWSRELYDESWNNDLKEFIRNRDNRRCQYPECSYTDIGKQRKLHVHHINRDKKNCSPYNLVSLCNSHHAVVEDDDYWIDYFYSITADYENNYSR